MQCNFAWPLCIPLVFCVIETNDEEKNEIQARLLSTTTSAINLIIDTI
jgi:hypothetical protein